MENSNTGMIQYSNTGNVIRSKVLVNLIFLSILVLIDLTPILERNLHPLIHLGVFALWFVSSRGLPVQNGNEIPAEMLRWWGIYTFWVIFMCLIRHSNISPKHYISTLYFYFIPYMMVVVLKSYNIREIKLLWKIFFIVFMVNLIQNYIIGFNNPDAFRLRDALDKSDNYFSNAGGTRFVTACLFMAPVFWLIIQGSTKRSLRQIMTIGVILIAVYISIINNRATATVILFVEMFMLLLLRYILHNVKSFVSIGVVLAILFIVSFFFLDDILELSINIFGNNERFLQRLEDMKTVSGGTNIEDLEEGSLSARYFLWMTSVNTFLSSVPNFLFGVGIDVHEGDIWSLVNYGVGCHSEFFDLPAKFGIIGVFIVYKFLSSFIQFTWKLSGSEKQKKIIVIFWLGFIFYSFVNGSFAAPVFYVLFIFLPTSIVLVNNKII